MDSCFLMMCSTFGVGWYLTNDNRMSMETLTSMSGLVRDHLLGHDALLYIAYVMLILAEPIPADRWHCSLRPWLTPWVDWHAPSSRDTLCPDSVLQV